MKSKSSPNKSWIQGLKYYKPLFPRNTSPQRSWRLKSYKLKITSRLQIQLKLRKFKTSPENRSKKVKQIVVRVRLLGIKELALSYKFKSLRRNKKQHFSLLPNIKLSTTMITMGFVGIFFFGLQMAGVGQKDPPIAVAQPDTAIQQTEIPAEPVVVKALSPSMPILVDIPAITVNAGIQKVGLLENGSIETPELFSNLVGWYEFGPTPGEMGPAVLVGHVDTYKGPSVFWELGNLKVNDIINISREDGTIAKFSVTEIAQYEQDNFPTEKIYGNIDYAGLRVITCGGTFNHVTGRYSHNTVIFASIVL